MAFQMRRDLLIKTAKFQLLGSFDNVHLSNGPTEADRTRIDESKEEMLQCLVRYDFDMGISELRKLGITLTGEYDDKSRQVHALEGKHLEATLVPKRIKEDLQEDLIITNLSKEFKFVNFYTKNLKTKNMGLKKGADSTSDWYYDLKAWSPNEDGFPKYYVSWNLSKVEYSFLNRIKKTHALTLQLKLK